MSNISISQPISNINLNANPNHSCSADDGQSGFVWNGIIFKDKKGGFNDINNVNCSRISATTPLGDYNLDNVCECQMVNAINGKLECPKGKFLRNYHPDLKKGTCCAPCTSDQKKVIDYSSTDCMFVKKSLDDNSLTCPNNKLVRSLICDGIGTELECCEPRIRDDLITKSPNSEISTSCKELGLMPCEPEKLKEVYGKCDAYGMKYYNSNDKTIHNPESFMSCHTSNFEKLEEMCAQNNISPCNVSGLVTSFLSKLGALNTKIDTNQEENLQKFNNLERKINEPKPEIIAIIVTIIVFLMLVMVFVTLKIKDME